MSPNILIAMNIVTLPPGTIMTRSARRRRRGPGGDPPRPPRARAKSRRVGSACSLSRKALTAGSTTWGGVLNSGWPTPRLMTSRPGAAIPRPREDGEGVLLAVRSKAALTAVTGPPDSGAGRSSAKPAPEQRPLLTSTLTVESSALNSSRLNPACSDDGTESAWLEVAAEWTGTVTVRVPSPG